MTLRDGDLQVYVHATCYSSYLLLKYLQEKGLAGKVRLLDASRAAGLDRLVLSVPWLTLGSRVAAADPVSGEEVELMIRDAYKPSIGDPVERFKATLLGSSYASSIALLYGDVSYAAFKDLVEAAIRSPFTGLDPGEILDVIRGDGRSLYEELEVKLAKVAATNYIRDLYWGAGGSRTEGEFSKISILSWLIAKAGIGRVGLPGNPLAMANKDGVELVLGVLEAEGDKLFARIRKEQETIFGDNTYIEFLKNLGFNLKI